MRANVERSLRYPLRQLRRSIRAGRPISWPNFRRLARRFGCHDPAQSLVSWRNLTRTP
jgi:hypothetical protein